MVSKQELRSEDTKKGIMAAAVKLFAERGFDLVTMREIAKEAGCSHTTIYIYFKDKEALLHQLSMPPLEALKQQMESIALQMDLTPEEKLKNISLAFIRLCLLHRNMHMIIFGASASRVDQLEKANSLNKVRIELFGLLQQALQECLQIEHNEKLMLMYSRIYFFSLHGIVGTYTLSTESLESLMERLSPTFEELVEVLLIGFKHKLKGVK
jgi:AcrR family transcriptional regulator